MRIHVICKHHGVTAEVGPGTLVSELECTQCIAEYDAANEFRPCCPYMNTTCCGHDDDYHDPYPVLVTIDSPNYCDGSHITTEPPF